MAKEKFKVATKHTTELPNKKQTRRSIDSLRSMYNLECALSIEVEKDTGHLRKQLSRAATLDLEHSQFEHGSHMDDVQEDPEASKFEFERENEAIRDTNTLLAFLFHFSPVVLAVVLTQCVIEGYMKLLLKLFASVVINKLGSLAMGPSLESQDVNSTISIYVKLEVVLFALTPSWAMFSLFVLVLMGIGGGSRSNIQGNHNRVNMYMVSTAIHRSERSEYPAG